ncbi:SNF2-related protein [Candidatus Marimicrobium litorale]|uniref:Uncharacterized protein n=1 Tax=Candidatus Marimicrobium litorale TaxID=2518991 RepID=A0ABT3T9W3_9GAMM|nr:SNF2-related protein [Candidatus Marimicrobium litorale]MCX2979083.1 hypothetical protein [Candidatus Marimicrobium litorale]
MSAFEWELQSSGVRLSLSRTARRYFSKKTVSIPVSDWSAGENPSLMTGLVALQEVFQDLSDSDLLKPSLLLPHEFIAGLSNADATALGLPTPLPYQTRIFSKGLLADNSFELEVEFLDREAEVFIDERVGSIARVGNVSYRVTSPVYECLNVIKSLGKSPDQKLEAIAVIGSLLGKANSEMVEPDKALSNIRIRQACAFSVRVQGELADPELTPILFARHLVEAASDSGDLLSESEQILGSEQSHDFSEQFLRGNSLPRTFLLRSGEYVYIDPDLRDSLEALRGVCHAKAEVKRAFVSAPRAVLAQFSEKPDEIERKLEENFIETSEFSDRVIGIEKWEPIELPFYVQETNDWGTDIMIFSQEGMQTPVAIPKERLSDAAETLSNAIAIGEAVCNIDGQQVMASTQLLDQIRALLPERPDAPLPEPAETESESVTPPLTGPLVLKTRSSFEELEYEAVISPRKTAVSAITPRALKPSTQLLKHQDDGLAWLVQCYNAGLPGGLMADDMGLGKTLQALVFLSVLKEQVLTDGKRPLLIVAPTGLLNNWLKEIEEHLLEGALGLITKAYGSALKSLKTGKGRDTDFGISLLDVERLREADVVLTTYETQRDYQQSFAQVRFGAVVLDEIQKTKNPKSLISRAATSLNADFKLGLSGTPVENSIADLWVLMDVVAHGLIRRSLKDFIEAFSGDPADEEVRKSLASLHEELLVSKEGLPSPILRRMKSEVFAEAGPDGKPMPQKIVHPADRFSREMPLKQAKIYSRFANEAAAGQIRVVEALAAFKKFSLSPNPPEKWSADPEQFSADSARLSGVFAIMDSIRESNEKAIVFLESRAFQGPLAQVIKERYELRRQPMIINGAISGRARQERVDAFQNSASGFDVIIVSPKAGGVGLTLTAANHVLHMERWWNPAVEDQCNDRAYRIGQRKDVQIYCPIAVHPQFQERSFDVVLDSILEHKRQLANTLLVPTEISPSSVFDECLKTNTPKKDFLERSEQGLYELETGEDFEAYIASMLSHHGFQAKLTPRSWDKGCDLVAIREDKKLLIQCKQVRSDCTLKNGVEEIINAASYYGDADSLVLVTNAKRITKPQRELAEEKSVILCLGDTLNAAGSGLASRLS